MAPGFPIPKILGNPRGGHSQDTLEICERIGI